MQREAELVRIDRSKPFLRQWYSKGYRAVRIKLADVSCRVCRSMRDAEFYIWNLMTKDNPIFRLTHPNCRCGLLPIDESNIDNELFNEKTGYKVKIRDRLEKTKPISKIPEKESPKNEEQELTPDAIKKKELAEKQIEETERKINEIEKKEDQAKSDGEEVDKKPGGVKEYLTKYLDKLKNFVYKLVGKK